MKANILSTRVAMIGLIYRPKKLIADGKMVKFVDNLASCTDEFHFIANHQKIIANENYRKGTSFVDSAILIDLKDIVADVKRFSNKKMNSNMLKVANNAAKLNYNDVTIFRNTDVLGMAKAFSPKNAEIDNKAVSIMSNDLFEKANRCA